jgi:hypothetical protein
VEKWFEVFIKNGGEARSEKVIEDVIGSHGLYGSKHYLVIVFPPKLIRKRVIGLIHLHELLLGLLIMKIAFGMVLKRKLPIGVLDVLEGGILGNSEDVVIVVAGIREVGAEELLLLFINKTVLVEESAKGALRICQRILPLSDLIVVRALVLVR